MSGSGGYVYGDAAHHPSHDYLLPSIAQVLDTMSPKPERIFDLGCGNGSVASWLHSRGHLVVGVDPSAQGVRQAKEAYPDLQIFLGSTSDDLAATYGSFPVVLSLEVVEHVYAPREFAAALFELTEPGGTAIVSTPYHGYWKNLALAISGKMDDHFTALWDHGHIKFWSIRTLSQLLSEAGFQDVSFHRVGRVKPLAKSMLAVATKQ